MRIHETMFISPHFYNSWEYLNRYLPNINLLLKLCKISGVLKNNKFKQRTFDLGLLLVHMSITYVNIISFFVYLIREKLTKYCKFFLSEARSVNK